MICLIKQMAFVPAVCASFCLLSACGNVSRDVATDGGGAKQLVWPAPESVTPMHRDGTYPNLDNLRQIRAGLNKSQIVNLIGYPHFNEGIFAVREWNYVFNFHSQENAKTIVCEYKILFDDARRAQSFYWNPSSCRSFLELSVAAAQYSMTLSLSTDELFAFDKSSISDITDGGRAQLDSLVSELASKNEKMVSFNIEGYTDRLGEPAYNDALSERRANAVMSYLIDRGVKRESIAAIGRGMTHPIKDCPDTPHDELVRCLAPNRRVVITVTVSSADGGSKRMGN